MDVRERSKIITWKHNGHTRGNTVGMKCGSKRDTVSMTTTHTPTYIHNNGQGQHWFFHGSNPIPAPITSSKFSVLFQFPATSHLTGPSQHEPSRPRNRTGVCVREGQGHTGRGFIPYHLFPPQTNPQLTWRQTTPFSTVSTPTTIHVHSIVVTEWYLYKVMETTLPFQEPWWRRCSGINSSTSSSRLQRSFVNKLVVAVDGNRWRSVRAVTQLRF